MQKPLSAKICLNLNGGEGGIISQSQNSKCQVLAKFSFSGGGLSKWGPNPSLAGADPGFSVGGGANPPERGHQPMILSNFPKNYMKLRKFWTVGGAHAGSTPLNPPLFRVNWDL